MAEKLRGFKTSGPRQPHLYLPIFTYKNMFVRSYVRLSMTCFFQKLGILTIKTHSVVPALVARLMVVYPAFFDTASLRDGFFARLSVCPSVTRFILL